MKKIMVTGFDPFAKEKINPSIEAVRRLPQFIAGCEVIQLEIPTVAHESLRVIEEALIQHDPDVILSIGQAGGRADISVERIGINCDDFSIPDNAGQQIIDEKVYESGPDAYFSNLPIKAIVKAINSAGIKSSVSNTAGTFVCNHTLYGVRHLIETKYPNKRSGFIHIPFLPEQVQDKPEVASMELETIIQGLIIAIETIVKTTQDIKEVGGATH